MSELDIPRVKVVKGIPSFRGELRLGNPEEYSSALCIQVERYYRTYVAKPPTASSFVLRSDIAAGQESAESSATAVADAASQEGETNVLTAVRSARTYQVTDEAAPRGKIDVERDDLAKGYEYGRTAVHISEADENITKLETDAALEIIGFIQSDLVCAVGCLSNVIGERLIRSNSTIDTCTCPRPISSSHRKQTIRRSLPYPLSYTLYSS